jgi:hypothetical protein
MGPTHAFSRRQFLQWLGYAVPISLLVVAITEDPDTLEPQKSSRCKSCSKQLFAIFLDNMADPRIAPVSVAAAQTSGDQFGREPVSGGPWEFSQW